MASQGYATGADQQPDGLRRRNVPNGDDRTGLVSPQTEEKAKQKVSFRSESSVGSSGSRDRRANQPTLQTKSIIDTLDEYEYIWAPILFTAAAFFTRMYKIGLSNIVTWDEAQ